MPPRPRSAHKPLAQLEAARYVFGPGQGSLVARILSQLSQIDFDDAGQLIRFHECLLFLRAFPRSLQELNQVERLLHSFPDRVNRLREANADLSRFDEFDTSGIAGTTMQDKLSFEVAHWLARSFPDSAEIAWDDYWQDYEGERARGLLWPRFIPLLEEDADVEATIPWQRWLDAARGDNRPLSWLLKCFADLPLNPRGKAELYGSLRLPIRWRVAGPRLSRTLNFNRPRHFFFHKNRLIARSEVSLAAEFARPEPLLKKLPRKAAAAVIESLREFMVVRYRELYGATFGDPRSVLRADLGRGAVLHLWGVLPEHRLPLRAYVCGYVLKNGVAINYFEAIGLCEWVEVGFNTFYTYRQGETAWVYAQILRCIRAVSGVSTISIYPYQIGFENEEAIDSGAFWFYRKLGFRPGRADLRNLCAREERRIAANPKYRTPRPTLKRLAEAHMFCEIADARNSRPHHTAETPTEISLTQKDGSWDRFSTRNLGLIVNRRMAKKFGGQSVKIKSAALAAVSKLLNIDVEAWSPAQRKSPQDWSLVLATIPDLQAWSGEEKSHLVRIIRAKSGLNEMSYWRQTQRHSRLRNELLKLSSKRFA